MQDFKERILAILKEDARRDPEVIATMLDSTVLKVRQAIEEMEHECLIIKYSPILNWNKIGATKVTALIEVQITPERGIGFEGIAEKVSAYPQVKTVYLMSGEYDLLIEIEGNNLREVASFVSDKLSTLASVRSTKTFFILKKYKQDGVILDKKSEDDRLLISP